MFQHHAEHLRDDVTGALDRHRVADAHAQPVDLVGVVQRCVRHHHTADGHRLEACDRRKGAGASDMNIDRLDDRRRLLGRKLVRERPARIAGDEAEPLLPVQAIDFVDHAIDVVIEARALCLDLMVEREHGVDGVAYLRQRIGLEAAGGEPVEHARLRLRRHRAHLAPAVGKEAKRARCRDRRIELAQRARRRVARVREDLAAGRLLPLIERQESGLGHVDLAADLANVGHAFAAQGIRDVGERSHVRE